MVFYLSLELLPSNPRSPHWIREWSSESPNLIMSLWWSCHPLSSDDTKLLYPARKLPLYPHILAPPNPSPATSPDISVLQPSWQFLGSLNLPYFISPLEVPAFESHSNVTSSGKLPQILKLRELPPLHSHDSLPFHILTFITLVISFLRKKEMIILTESPVSEPVFGSHRLSVNIGQINEWMK